MNRRFELDNFAGPLDLLLYLVQRQEVDIREVSLVDICDQYVEEIEKLKGHDLEPAGEFFVMAATLMSIKARSLLPEEEVDLEEALDPEEELIQQLLEYRRIKEVSRELKHRAQARSLVHPPRPEVSDAGIPLEEVEVFDLVQAFRKILQETGLDRERSTIRGERPVSLYINDLLDRLRKTPTMSFFKVFAPSKSRLDLIGYFLAVLELIRHEVIRARQDQSFGEIRIEANGAVPDSLTSVMQPLTSSAEAETEPRPETSEETQPAADSYRDAAGPGPANRPAAAPDETPAPDRTGPSRPEPGPAGRGDPPHEEPQPSDLQEG